MLRLQTPSLPPPRHSLRLVLLPLVLLPNLPHLLHLVHPLHLLPLQVLLLQPLTQLPVL